MKKFGKEDRLKILSQIAVPVPCSEDWNAMHGTDRSRYCDHCCHSVINLSALSKSEAAKTILNSNPGTLCIRYTATPDGSIQFKDQPQSRGFFVSSAAMFTAVLAAFGLVSVAQADPNTGSQTASPTKDDSTSQKDSNCQQEKSAEAKAETNQGKTVMGSPVVLPGTSHEIKSLNATPTPAFPPSTTSPQTSQSYPSLQPEVVGKMVIIDPKK